MLELRPGCECCNVDLPPESTEARICSFECTFCAKCAGERLDHKCPNCDGELVPRPRRPAVKLANNPAATTRVFKPGGCAGVAMSGNVSFIELGTPDAGGSHRFFERVFGWCFNPMPRGGGWFQAPSLRVGVHVEDQPQIYVFFEVPDLENAMALVREAGGEADAPPQEEPGFGRFSFCRDPRGVRFGLHQRSGV